MGMSISKCLSVLVASGNGAKCNELRSVLISSLLVSDETGKSKIDLHKNYRNDVIFGADSLRVGKEILEVIHPIMEGIPSYFYGPDKKQIKGRN